MCDLSLQAFTIIAVLNSMRFSLGVLPFAVKSLADAQVSFKRYKVGCHRTYFLGNAPQTFRDWKN